MILITVMTMNEADTRFDSEVISMVKLNRRQKDHVAMALWDTSNDCGKRVINDFAHNRPAAIEG